MQFIETPLKGAFEIALDPKTDARGAFSRLFCKEAFEKQGLAAPAQINLSKNPSKGTLRGLHYQEKPYEEAKTLFCLQGTIFDVIVDLRPNSFTYKRHFSIVLDGNNALYIPAGFAHGFQTLEDDVQLLYLMSEAYRPGFERGYRWNDPAFEIDWPQTPTLISERDLNHRPFEPAYA